MNKEIRKEQQNKHFNFSIDFFEKFFLLKYKKIEKELCSDGNVYLLFVHKENGKSKDRVKDYYQTIDEKASEINLRLAEYLLDKYALDFRTDYHLLHPKDDKYKEFEILFNKEIKRYLEKKNCKVEVHKYENDFIIRYEIPKIIVNKDSAAKADISADKNVIGYDKEKKNCNVKKGDVFAYNYRIENAVRIINLKIN